MKKLFSAVLLILSLSAQAQIGIGTTSPNSMLDVRGSLSTAVTTFSANTTAGASDNMFLFNAVIGGTCHQFFTEIAGEETFLKWLSIDTSKIENTKAYLIKAVTNSCLNHLQSFQKKKKQYLDSITQENTTDAVSPRLKKLIGAVKLPKNFDEKKELQSYLEKKHL